MLDLDKIRKTAIIAMFSDDDLMDMLVLKGGNAISLLYDIYTRASVDLDFSMEGDFEEGSLPLIEEKITKVLKTTFREKNLLVFDIKFYEKPKVRTMGLKEFWGGYRVEFKLIEKEKHEELKNSIDVMRKSSIPFESSGKKTFTIDISKYEFCKRKQDTALDGYTIYVYTPEMLVIEKMRAICQQMPEYPYGTKSARARDFFDIYLLMEHFHIDLLQEENLELIQSIFTAKEVPVELIRKIPEYKDFHERDFSSVVNTVPSGFDLEDYDFYFNYTVRISEQLEILWNK